MVESTSTPGVTSAERTSASVGLTDPGVQPGTPSRDTPRVSSANLELGRSLLADWERGDFTSAEWAGPEIEFTLADGPDPRSWTGIARLAEGWRAFQSACEGFRSEPTAFRELDDEHVLALVRFVGRAKTSGMELGQMQTQQASLPQIRGAKVTRLVLYWGREHALADLGLAPDCVLGELGLAG
jgi:hypothetical protein